MPANNITIQTPQATVQNGSGAIGTGTGSQKATQREVAHFITHTLLQELENGEYLPNPSQIAERFRAVTSKSCAQPTAFKALNWLAKDRPELIIPSGKDRYRVADYQRSTAAEIADNGSVSRSEGAECASVIFEQVLTDCLPSIRRMNEPLVIDLAMRYPHEHIADDFFQGLVTQWIRDQVLPVLRMVRTKIDPVRDGALPQGSRVNILISAPVVPTDGHKFVMEAALIATLAQLAHCNVGLYGRTSTEMAHSVTNLKTTEEQIREVIHSEYTAADAILQNAALAVSGTAGVEIPIRFACHWHMPMLLIYPGGRVVGHRFGDDPRKIVFERVHGIPKDDVITTNYLDVLAKVKTMGEQTNHRSGSHGR